MKKVVLLTGIAAVCASLQAWAGSANPILEANNEISAGVIDTQNNYSEDLPSPSDTEHGSIPGLHLGISVDKIVYARVSYDQLHGNITYYNGNHTENSEHDSWDLRFRLGHTFLVRRDLAITPYLTGGYRQWHRVVTDSIATYEDYHNGYVGIGGLLQYAVSKRFVVGFHASMGEVVNAGVHGPLLPIFAEVNGIPDEQQFRLADRPYYSVGLRASYRITEHLGLYATIGYRDFQYGSSGRNEYDIGEPSSETSQASAGLGIDYQF